jgi:hypothetical protein
MLSGFATNAMIGSGKKVGHGRYFYYLSLYEEDFMQR